MFIGAALPPAPARRVAVERAWSQLASSGPTLTPRERSDIITGARRAWAGAEAPDPASGVTGIATYWLAVDAEGITHDLIADFVSRGLAIESYLEIVGVVARLSNIDWYMRGIGADIPSLLEPAPTKPTRNIAADARITDSWVPMLDKAMAPHALDALPDEGAALRNLLEPMYIETRSIGDWTLDDELSRPQIEYIAARTSYLNECFY